MTRILSVITALVVGVSPVALGSNRPLAWALNAIAVGPCGLLTAMTLAHPRTHVPPLRLGLVLPSLLLWGLAMAWAALQTLNLDGGPLPHPSWSILSEVLGQDGGGAVSVRPDATVLSITRLVTYVLLFLCVYALARRAEDASIMLRGLVVFSILYGAYGLFRYAGASGKILWFDAPSSASLSSTFINSNTAATYFGLMACASLGLVLRRGRRLFVAAQEERAAHATFDVLLRGLAGWFGVELVTFIFLLTALILTQSRAGVAATITAFFVGLLLHATRDVRGTQRRVALAVAGIVCLAVAFVAFNSGGGVVHRVAATDVSTEGRLTVYRDALFMLRDHQLAGAGLGTFQDIYPLYRSETGEAGLVWDKAHNDYLEILVGLGIPAGGAAILGIVILSARCLQGNYRRRQSAHFALIGAMASVVVGLHALVDFSLQVQAVAMTFTALLGLGVSQSTSERGS